MSHGDTPTDGIRALAEAIADVLEERGLVGPSEPTPGRVLKVADVAKLLGRSRPWVYEHKAELGAFRFGNGPKARIGFDREAIERWKRDQQMLKASPSAPAARRRGRQRKTVVPAAVNLISYEPLPGRLLGPDGLPELRARLVAALPPVLGSGELLARGLAA